MTPAPTQARQRTVAEWWRWLLLLLCGVGTVWAYHALAKLGPRMISAAPTGVSEIFPWVRAVTFHSLQSARKHGPAFQDWMRFLECIGALFAMYAAMLWAARGTRSRAFSIAGAMVPIVSMGLLLLATAMLSTDTYAYAFYGRVLGIHGANAHAAAPAASLTDPFLCKGWQQWGPSRYGPLWTVMSSWITGLGGEHVGLTLLLFRSLGAASAIACAWLIWLITALRRPGQASLAMVLFLWNPLVLIECALSGHNDAVMMAFALLALWMHLRGWRAGAVAALALSAMIKVISLPLIPLYVVMLLRETPGWKQRGLVILRSSLAAVVVIAASMLGARMNPSGFLVRAASSAAFYKNNYHELVFKQLRRMLGENPSTLEAPMDFHIWWVATSDRASLHLGLSNKSRDLARLAPHTVLLALSEKDSDQWLRVYDPAARIIGFVPWSHLYQIPEPPGAMNDPVIRRLAVSPDDWPTVITANRWIRIVSLGLLAVFGLLAAWRVRGTETFIAWSAAFFLAAILLIFTQLWPWYALWPLAYGALQPGRRPALLAMLLSFGFTTLYALFGYENTHFGWVCDYRSLFAVALPVALFALLQLPGLFRRGDAVLPVK